MLCSRCGLARPEAFGRGWRCACCGLEYCIGSQVVRRGPAKPSCGGSIPLRCSNKPAGVADPGLLERKLWCWWWMDITG